MISSLKTAIGYNTNGTQKRFPFPYALLSEGYLEITLDDIPVESGYTVTLQTNRDLGAVVEFTTAPATGQVLVISRATPITQTEEFVAGSNFDGDKFEGGLDKLTMIIQERGFVCGDCIPLETTVLAAVANGADQIDLTWNAVVDPSRTGYELQRSLDGETGWITIASPAADATTHSDTGLDGDTTYFFRLRAVGGVLESDWSNTASATTDLAIPAAPSDLTAAVASVDSITLNWTDNSDNEDNFIIQRSLDGIDGWVQVLTPAANATSDTDTGLNGGVLTGIEYFYRAAAANAAGTSAWSNIASATIEAAFGFFDEEGMLTSAVIHGVNTGSSATRYSIDDGTQVGLGISTEDFVVQAWICRDQESTQSRILGKGNINATDLGYSLEVTDNVVKFRMGDGTSSAEVTGTIAYRRWHHIMASADRDGNIELFIDGVSTGTAAALAATIANAEDFRMMTTDNSGTRRFRGYVSMCGVWSGITIDAAGALALFNAGIPVNYDAMSAGQKTGLVSFWELNENINTSFGFDRLGANNLTRQNTSGGDGFRHFHKPAAQFIAASSQYLDITNTAQSGLSPGATPFSFLAWVSMAADGVTRGIAGKWDTGQAEWLVAKGADNLLYFNASLNGSSSVFVSKSLSASFTKYKMILAVWDGVSIKLSVDGSAFSSTAFAGPIHIDISPFRIGSYVGLSSFMEGEISNAAFYSRALTVADAIALTKSFAPEYPLGYSELTAAQKVDLVSWWTLEEKIGTRIDSHGGNDLTQNNGVEHAVGIVPDPAAEYPAPVNAAVTAWVNRSSVVDVNKFGDLRVIQAGFAPRKHATLMLDWGTTAQGGFHTFVGRVNQPGTVIILGTTSLRTGNDQYFFDGYYPGMAGTVDRWAGLEGDPGNPMRMFAGSAVDSGLSLAGGQTLWIWIFDGADSELHQDAVSADPIPSSPGANDLVGLSVGARYDVNSAQQYQGSMKLVVVLDRRITPQEITDLIAELNP